MTSQLELRLQRSISQDENLVLRATSKAKLACYLARIGEFDRAEELRLDLRGNFGDGKFPRISVLLMLLDGLLVYYRDLGFAARDRISRANLISTSLGIHDLTSLTSAWLAHLAFNRCDYDGMTAEIRKCLSLISHDDDSARVRVSLVLGDAFLFSKQSSFSQSWYENARMAAVRQGDQAALGALTYNRAALNIHNLQLKEVGSVVSSDEMAFSKTELQTAINYQSLARLKSLDHLLTAAQIGLDVVRGDFASADKLATGFLEAKCMPREAGEHITILSNLAVSRAKTGHFESSQNLIAEIESFEINELNADDRAIIYFALSKTQSAIGDDAACKSYVALATQALLEYQEMVERLRELLKEFSSVRN